MPFHISIQPMEEQRDDLDRIVLMRDMLEMPPFAALINLMNELLAEDALPFDIVWAYHDLASHIMRSALPVVTGDRWRDFILWGVLCRDHPFARAAVKRRVDDTMLAAMRKDLKLMQSLFLLDDGMVRNWCAAAKPVFTEQWTRWTAESVRVPEDDAPLPSMQRALIYSEDWEGMAVTLKDFFAEHGCGCFLGAKAFTYDGTLRPVSAPNVKPLSDVDCGVESKRALSDYMDVFAGGAWRAPAVVTGGAARIRTELIRACALDAGLTLVEAQGGHCPRLGHLLDTLSVQPQRFLLYINGFAGAERELAALMGETLDKPVDNVLAVLTPGKGWPQDEQDLGGLRVNIEAASML